jgi:hypothetical protein
MIIARNPTRIGLAFSRLFGLPRQRHRCWMILELLVQFAIEFARTVMIDALSGRIRGQLGVFRRLSGTRGTSGVLGQVHRSNRDRLFHRLRTGRNQDL